ncbi:hypothetical protein [Flavobacterium sp.]|uniref:hypothetical protein n=1 Tax=Flavobacterium sp. TaxID=239 RepID=UPI0038FC5911
MIFIEKIKQTILILALVLLPYLAFAQHPKSVEAVLKKAGKNRIELEKAIRYCKISGNPLKIKAMNFLIANMDIHFSADYYWVDKVGKKINYNELVYPNFEQALKAFEILKNKNPGIHPKTVIYKDIEKIKGDFLIQNLENAFKAWNSSIIKNIPFESFCEYILPYRVSVEPIQNWRNPYKNKFRWLNQKVKTEGLKSALLYVRDDYVTWFTNTYGKEARKEPLPRLGALQLLLRKQGSCEDIVDLEVFTMRSQGIPASVNVIPYWATATGSHFVNTVFDSKMHPIKFDIHNSKPLNEVLSREPSKVLRLTYSKQPGILASFESKINIPSGILRTQNYIDITKEYWETTDIDCTLFASAAKPKVVYASVFNGLNWKPCWWGKVKEDKTTFSSMCKGTVILPQYYSNGKYTTAGYPVVVNNKKSTLLMPDELQTRYVLISEMPSYLKFKQGITYKLFYWNKSWKLIDIRVAESNTQSMLFTKVPKNALLLFLASDSKHLERPFIVNDDGNRTWF